MSTHSNRKSIYFVERTIAAQVLKSIKEGEKNILITSDLGNGKTLFLEGLAITLSNAGYTVAIYQKWYDSIINEITEICENWSNAVIIIEGYNNAFPVLELLQTRRGKNLVVITAERTSVFETTFNKLEKVFSTNYSKFSLDYLDEREIEDFIILLNNYGLWGDYSAKTDFEKFSMVKVECNHSLKLLLLKILESETIIKRFKNLIDDIQSKKNYFEAIIFILISNLLNFRLDLELLVNTLNETKFRKPAFQNDSSIKELINFRDESIKVQSSILSEVILSKISDPVQVVDILSKICAQLDLWTDDLNIRSMLRELVSFSNLSRIINSERDVDDLEIIEKYFNQLRNLYFCRVNPYFWLQYAILNIEKRNMPLAKQQFESAYAYAKKQSRFDTYQLDNQFARFLILNEIETGFSSTSMGVFTNAHRILTASKDPNHNKHYTYKVAQHYIDFYDAFSSKLSKDEKGTLIKQVNEMTQRMKLFLVNVNDFRTKRRVESTMKQLEKIYNDEKIRLAN